MEYYVRWGVGVFLSALLIIGGTILIFTKPSRNNTFGYVSKLSLQNDKYWHFANKILSYTMIGFGLLLLVITIVLNLLKVKIAIFMPAFMVSLVIGLFFMVWLPKVKLKKYIAKCESDDVELI